MAVGDMRERIKALAPVLALLGGVAACSGGGSGADAGAGAGRTAAQVCAGFAKAPVDAAALQRILGGGEGLDDDLSEREKAVAALRDAAAQPAGGRAVGQGEDYCWVGRGADRDMKIEAGTAPGVPEGEDPARGTWYGTGAYARASDGVAFLYFGCRVPGAVRDMTVRMVLRGPGDGRSPEPSARADRITVANAAARALAGDLRCTNDTELVTGVPRSVPAPR
ncbi:hypothetical protein ABT160_03485 [Streptomyces sp. NPDC001941]|uniref:hypothetical protein n=1 Tax=Streptomyces sp. NPDC001941 TaxID=3154659 RepID=UPI0033236D99